MKHQYWGKTRNNKVVVFLNDIYDNLMSSDNSLVGKFADIRILKVDSYTLYGELINVKKK